MSFTVLREAQNTIYSGEGELHSSFHAQC